MKSIQSVKVIACFFCSLFLLASAQLHGQSVDKPKLPANYEAIIKKYHEAVNQSLDDDASGFMREGRMGGLNHEGVENALDDFSADLSDPTPDYDPDLVSNYWIGVQCSKASDTKLVSSDFPDIPLKFDGGMIVQSVTAGQAAAAAGVEVNDVILSFGNNSINSLNDLFAAIGKAEDNETKLVVIRDGVKEHLKITPKERPQSPVEANVEFSRVMSDLDQMVQQQLLSGDSKIPDGYEIVLRAKGGAEAELRINKGETQWMIDQSTLSKLPNEIYPAATRWFDFANSYQALAAHGAANKEQQLIHWELVMDALKNQQKDSLWQYAEAASDSGSSVGDKLEALQEQVAKLIKVVDEMKAELDK